jgi:hypothetical protein
MSNVLQHIFVLILVAGCVAWIVRGAVRTMRQQRGGFGKCCERGCEANSNSQTSKKQGVTFIPVEFLSKKH